MNLPNPRNQPYDDRTDPIDDPFHFPPEEHQQFAPAAPPLRDAAYDEPVEQPLFAPDAPPMRNDYDQPGEYDPVWTGQGNIGPSDAVAQTDLERIEEILSSERFRNRRRTPDMMPPPPQPAPKRHSVRWALGTFALLVGTSAFIAYVTTDRVPLLDSAADAGGAMSRVAGYFAPAPSSQRDAQEAQAPAAPKPASKTHLVVNGASADSPDQILVGVSVEGVSEGMSAVVAGLVPGTTLTSGRPWGSTGWILPAGELETAYLRPPAGFSGVMEYSVSLQRPDNSVIDRQTMRLEWTAPTAQQPAPPAPQTEARTLTPDEVASMLKRGETLLMEGDIASARLLLQRAAEAQDARAAFTLAATYDPIEMKRLGVYGAAPDVTKARDWYERARQYGSREAPKRLELLASQFR